MKKAFRPAFAATIPVLCGYLFIGFAFGVMLRDIGYGSLWAFFCSLSIYAGSGQYLLVSLLAAKASLVTVAVMTLLLYAVVCGGCAYVLSPWMLLFCCAEAGIYFALGYLIKKIRRRRR